MGMDAGYVNFGAGVIDLADKTAADSAQKVVWSGYFLNTIRDLVYPPNLHLGQPNIVADRLWWRLESLRLEFHRMLVDFQPDLVVIERFQVRGMMTGASAEKIGIMIGIMLTTAYDLRIPVRLITAAAWKNAWLREIGRSLDDTVYQLVKIKNQHPLDAVLLARYGALYPYGQCFAVGRRNPQRAFLQGFDYVQ